MSWPDYRDYEHHAHKLVLHTAVVDSSQGSASWPDRFHVRFRSCEFRRPGPGFNDFRFEYSDLWAGIDSIADPDTVDTFWVMHCHGLAQHLGGDTTHFARLDSRPGWEWCYRAAFSLYEGDYGEDEEVFLVTLPDSVTTEVHVRVEVTLPLLYEYDSRGRRHINLDYVHITRIDTN